MSSSRQGQMPMRSAFGQGMCQKVMMVALRQPLADHPGREREVVVLHEDDRVVGVDLVAHRVGEPLVDADVVLPVLGAEDRARVRDVAERPEPLVGEAVVVAVLFALASATLGAAGTTLRPGGTRTRSFASTVSRSALPLPWATQTPEQARITGSSAVTRPLAGWSDADRRRRSSRGCRARGWRG